MAEKTARERASELQLQIEDRLVDWRRPYRRGDIEWEPAIRNAIEAAVAAERARCAVHECDETANGTYEDRHGLIFRCCVRHMQHLIDKRLRRRSTGRNP